MPKKLIEVAMPLDVINAASAYDRLVTSWQDIIDEVEKKRRERPGQTNLDLM